MSARQTLHSYPEALGVLTTQNAASFRAERLPSNQYEFIFKLDVEDDDQASVGLYMDRSACIELARWLLENAMMLTSHPSEEVNRQALLGEASACAQRALQLAASIRSSTADSDTDRAA